MNRLGFAVGLGTGLLLGFVFFTPGRTDTAPRRGASAPPNAERTGNDGARKPRPRNGDAAPRKRADASFRTPSRDTSPANPIRTLLLDTYRRKSGNANREPPDDLLQAALREIEARNGGAPDETGAPARLHALRPRSDPQRHRRDLGPAAPPAIPIGELGTRTAGHRRQLRPDRYRRAARRRGESYPRHRRRRPAGPRVRHGTGAAACDPARRPARAARAGHPHAEVESEGTRRDRTRGAATPSPREGVGDLAERVAYRRLGGDPRAPRARTGGRSARDSPVSPGRGRRHTLERAGSHADPRR